MNDDTTTTTIPPCGRDPIPIDPSTGRPYFCGPINEPATGGPGATRGNSYVIEPRPPERCLDGSGEYSFYPCTAGEDGFAVYVDVAEPPVAPQATDLPVTGAETLLIPVAAALIALGTLVRRLSRQP